MIVAEFRKVDDARGCVELVVRNVGPTLARAVKIDFEPALIVSKDADGPLTKMLTKRYENPIATLTPGQTLRNIWFAAHSGPDGRFVNAEPTPDRVTVKASYQGRGRGRYHDRFDLDVETITLETFAVGSDSLFGRVETMASSLKTLSKAVQEIAHAREEQRD